MGVIIGLFCMLGGEPVWAVAFFMLAVIDLLSDCKGYLRQIAGR